MSSNYFLFILTNEVMYLIPFAKSCIRKIKYSFFRKELGSYMPRLFMTMSGDIFRLPKWCRELAPGLWWVAAKDASIHSTIYQTLPPFPYHHQEKNYLAQNIKISS